MTKIDFLYNVDHFTNGLRLILSNFYDNQKTLIYAHDGHKNISDSLWQFEGFYPHHVGEYADEENSDANFLIGNQFNYFFDELLINVSATDCLFFSRFANLIEVVTQDQLIKDGARNRLKKYRDYGFNVNLINYQELTN